MFASPEPAWPPVWSAAPHVTTDGTRNGWLRSSPDRMISFRRRRQTAVVPRLGWAVLLLMSCGAPGGRQPADRSEYAPRLRLLRLRVASPTAGDWLGIQAGCSIVSDRSSMAVAPESFWRGRFRRSAVFGRRRNNIRRRRGVVSTGLARWRYARSPRPRDGVSGRARTSRGRSAARAALPPRRCRKAAAGRYSGIGRVVMNGPHSAQRYS